MRFLVPARHGERSRNKTCYRCNRYPQWFYVLLLIFFSSTSALFVPIQQAFSTGFQYLFPCHTSTFSAKSGAMAAALADLRMDIFGGCSNCLKSFLSVSGCDSPWLCLGYTMVIWARCQLLRKLAGCFESWRPLQPKRKWCDKLGYRGYWCTEGQCWIILNNLEFMCCFTENKLQFMCAFFPKERMPSWLWSNILNERFLYFTSPLTATVADASMPLCVLGPEIKLNNQCHTAVCMVLNIFQHDHPTNSPDRRCKMAGNLWHTISKGLFQCYKVTSGLSGLDGSWSVHFGITKWTQCLVLSKR